MAQIEKKPVQKSSLKVKAKVVTAKKVISRPATKTVSKPVKKISVKTAPIKKVSKPVPPKKTVKVAPKKIVSRPASKAKPTTKTVSANLKSTTSSKKKISSQPLKAENSINHSVENTETKKESKEEKVTDTTKKASCCCCEDEVGLAAFSYAWILFAIPLFMKKDSEFVQFHAKQGAVLFAISILFFWFPPIWFLLIVISVIAIVKTLSGEKWEIPVVSSWSKKINF